MSKVVQRFMMEQSEDRTVTTMTIDDAEHYTPEERAKIIASYPPHEREARALLAWAHQGLSGRTLSALLNVHRIKPRGQMQGYLTL